MRDRKLINRYKIFWKAMIADAKWLPATWENPEITEDSIISSGSRELCKTPEDIKESETILKLIALTEQRAWDLLDVKNSNISALNVYAKLVFKTPMTKKEKDYLISFFRDDKTQKTAQDILSKINLLYWDENSEFVDSFLKNEDWKLDIFWFVQYITKQLEEYKLIVPDDTEDIKELKKWDELVSGAKYFTYKIDWKLRVCVVSDWEIIFLHKDLESVKLLDNWMIFWVEKIDFDPKTKEKQIWHLYIFFNKKYIFEVQEMPEVVDLDIVPSLSSELSTVFKTQNEKWKKWLLEMAKENKQETLWEFKTLIANNNDNILINGKFITAISRWEKLDTHTTYIKLQDIGISCWWLKRMVTTSAKKENPYFELKDLWDNLISIETNEWKNIYKFNERESRLESIDRALLNMSFVNMNNLLNWKPAVITKEEVGKWWFGLYIFNKKTCGITMLIEETDFTHRIEGDMIKSKVGNKHIIHFWKNWVLYKLKDWYKYVFNYWAEYIKKWFFWNYIYIEDDFEEMKEFLEPINKNLLPIDLKSI